MLPYAYRFTGKAVGSIAGDELLKQIQDRTVSFGRIGVPLHRLRRETNYDRICALLDYPVNIVGYVVPALILWLMVFKPF
jgi:hypothetical protein